MLNDHRPFRVRRWRAPTWIALLILPLVASACITVENGLTETAGPTLGASSPGVEVGPTQAPLASPTPTPTPQPTPEPVEAEVLGFLPHWQLESAADTIDPELLTVLAFHSVEASADGKLVSKKGNGEAPPGWRLIRSPIFVDLKDRLQAEGVKVVPVIQRTAWTEGTRERMVTLLSKRKNRRALAERIATFVSERGFDGVNLDFEPLPKKVAPQFHTFVREVRAALDEVDPGLHLSVDVVPSLENYDLAALTADGAADLAVLMGYGYRTAESSTSGSVGPLVDPPLDLSTTVERALTQAAGEDLLLALPWYGLAWSTKTDGAGSEVRSGKGIDNPATTDYAAAVGVAAEHGRQLDDAQAAAWTAYATRQCTTCPATWRQVWYEDPDTFSAKMDLALDSGLAGVGIWALGMDGAREEMRAALRNQLHPIVDEAPPNGSPALDPESVQGDIDGRAVVAGSANLRLFADDDPGGSGLLFARIGLDGALDEDGMLAVGRTYPAVDRIIFPLGDESTGGSSVDGPRSIHVQWRDLAGNWSTPVVIEAHVVDPTETTVPADL